MLYIEHFFSYSESILSKKSHIIFYSLSLKNFFEVLFKILTICLFRSFLDNVHLDADVLYLPDFKYKNFLFPYGFRLER